MAPNVVVLMPPPVPPGDAPMNSRMMSASSATSRRDHVACAAARSARSVDSDGHRTRIVSPAVIRSDVGVCDGRTVDGPYRQSDGGWQMGDRNHDARGKSGTPSDRIRAAFTSTSRARPLRRGSTPYRLSAIGTGASTIALILAVPGIIAFAIALTVAIAWCLWLETDR
jgi:hypothetical protein